MSKKKQNSTAISNIYKSRKIILEILGRRGYDVSDYVGFSINEISIMNKNETLDMLLKDEKNNKSIYVKYHLNTKIRDSTIYEYIDELYNVETILNPDDELIIVAKEKANDTQTKLMETIYAQEEIYFSIYNYHNYLFNILEHSQVPPHRILSDLEKNEIMKKYNILKLSEFPEISRFDPVAQAIGLRPGQLCEIIRPSHTALNINYYRLCY